MQRFIRNREAMIQAKKVHLGVRNASVQSEDV